MLSRTAALLLPALGHLRITADPLSSAADTVPEAPDTLDAPDAPDAPDTVPTVAPGSIVAANHTSLADPVVVLAALHRLGARPVVLATAGLWRIPLLGTLLRREGHIAVHRGTARAAESLDAAAEALAAGRVVLIYGEGGLPRRRDSGELPPGPFRSGLARLAHATGAPVVPLGQAGSRRLTSGGTAKQLAGLATAPLRRPGLHVHLGAPLHLPADTAEATARAHHAVTAAWTAASRHAAARAAGGRRAAAGHGPEATRP
ncbi:1-acyl-sn-glycerol-3-phosphate acyltransferases [Streptomyces sp. TLI_053]|uniref:lysophospholipid acyltransferase family protein n=1 Tax=Streptomyces sp. TLI_053 TaxID=1855352 RepID=UPI00087C26A5|nr:lysophospholipid acyltransferase family protein [Streptomyces sp. TLI_053]SDS95329.1 1-acyl-sn-glycerol-3-phosphate acyltransferases [Streptomyces sp. TLI_053]